MLSSITKERAGMMAIEQAEKVRENRLRRMAQRQGLRLDKSRRRDPRAIDFGTYMLVDLASKSVVSSERASLDDIERYLTGGDD